MTKREFLAVLRKCLPKDDVEEQINYYSEMIDDRMEEGLSEEEAVSQIGSIEDIIEQPPQPPKAHKRKLKAWEIVLLALGSPIWVSLLAAAFAVFISLYAALWSVIVSVWAVFASLAACGVAGIPTGVVMIFTGAGTSGLFFISAGLVCCGLSIFLFFGCKLLTEGTVVLTKKFFIWLKNCFTKKEEA